MLDGAVTGLDRLPVVAAVVVNWHRPGDTLKALSSLASMNPAANLFICVENGNDAGETAQVRKAAPAGTVLIELAENNGFAGAVNIGVTRAIEAGAQWVLLLNNDAVALPECIGRCLIDAEQSPRTAAVGPAIAFAEDPSRLWYAGGEVSSWFAFTRHRGLLKSAANPPPSSETAFVTGCCMLISVEAWNEIGPFRADYFAYYEDAEWCQRARAQGWITRYVGEVLCLHAVSASAEQRGSLGLSVTSAYYLGRNPVRFALDTKSLPHRVSRVVGLMTVWNAYNAWRLLQGKRIAPAFAYLQGLQDAFRNRMGPKS